MLDEFPDDAGASNDLGYLWADQGVHLQRALKMIRQAVAAEPDNAAYRDSLGWVYYRLGRYQEAVAELEKAARQGTGGDVLDHLGDAQLKAGQPDKADDAWRRAAAPSAKTRKSKRPRKWRRKSVEELATAGLIPAVARNTRGTPPASHHAGTEPMSGHSHWSTIKHKKAAVDAKRGKVWSKLAKAIIVAAKHGGGDADMNLRLRYAIDDAKAMGMPKDNIQRAIKRGTGELDGGNLDEVLYEGYGAGGVAILCEVLTDNRNRTAPEIRKVFELSHGKLGNTGCVAWMFETKGIFVIPAAKIDEEKLLEIALEAGADDVKRDGANFAVTCDQAIYREVGKALADAGLQPESRRDHPPAEKHRRSGRRQRPQGAQAHGAAGRPRRRAERGLELQHPRRGDGGNRRRVKNCPRLPGRLVTQWEKWCKQ